MGALACGKLSYINYGGKLVNTARTRSYAMSLTGYTLMIMVTGALAGFFLVLGGTLGFYVAKWVVNDVVPLIF